MGTETILLIILIPVGIIAISTFIIIWWKVKQIKKDVKDDVYISDEKKKELKEKGIKIKDYKEQLRKEKQEENNNEDKNTSNDYLDELRGMV